MRKALFYIVLAVLLAALAAADARNDFGKSLLYALCTIAAVTATVGVTIGSAVRLGRGRPGWSDRPGYVEAGLLIGVFLVAPAALSGAFAILNAVIGPL